MIWIVDTCVVLDVLENDPDFGMPSAMLLEARLGDGLAVSPVTMIELAPAFAGDLRAQKRFLDLANRQSSINPRSAPGPPTPDPRPPTPDPRPPTPDPRPPTSDLRPPTSDLVGPGKILRLSTKCLGKSLEKGNGDARKELLWRLARFSAIAANRVATTAV
jgi:hypothetical protein